MEEEFETVVDDGTEKAIASNLIVSWRCRADPASIQAVQALEAEADRAAKRKVEGLQRDDIQEESEGEEEEDGEGEDGDGMDVDPVPALVEHQAPPQPQVDEDGFTIVTKKRRR